MEEKAARREGVMFTEEMEGYRQEPVVQGLGGSGGDRQTGHKSLLTEA